MQKSRRLSDKLYLDISLAYAGLGEPVSGLWAGANHFHCERWLNSSMSPLFLKRSDKIAARLKIAEAYFRRKRPRHIHDSEKAYVNILGMRFSESTHPAMKAAQALGWRPVEKLTTLNGWTKRLPLVLPKEFYFCAGHYFEKPLYRYFRKTMIANFGVKPKFMQELNLMHRGIEDQLRTVVIYHASGDIAGAGLVATKNGRAYLYCGSVSKKYRGKRLWNFLVSARQMISAEMGARFWVTMTSTAEIMGKGEFSFPVTTLYKAVPDNVRNAALHE